MTSLRAKILTKLIDELNAIPELEGKMGEESDEEKMDPMGEESMEKDPKGASIEMMKVSKEDPRMLDEMKKAMSDEPEMESDDEMEEDPFAKLKGRSLIKKKMI
jgi:hypothetical protein